MDMAEALNLGCLCSTLQPELLHQELDTKLGLEGVAQKLAIDQPHLFSASPVFISTRDFETLARSVAVLHRISDLPAYQASALQRASHLASVRFGPQGVFMGYDFHMSVDGPRLIEINTNAGGALLHAAAARAHRSCCEPVPRMFHGPATLDQLDQVFVAMFRAEWQAQRGDAPLRTVAIVDDGPATQYLAPEFELARESLPAACGGRSSPATSSPRPWCRPASVWSMSAASPLASSSTCAPMRTRGVSSCWRLARMWARRPISAPPVAASRRW